MPAAAGSPARAGSAIACDAGPFGAPVAIEIASGKPFVPVRINGSSPRRFILDTGSFNAAIDRRLAGELGFVPTTVLSTSAGAGRSGGAIVRLAPAACEQMGGAALQDGTVLGMDLGRVSAADGLRSDGLLGGDLFARYVFAIDYAARAIRVFPAAYEYQGSGIVVPVRLEQNHAYADIAIRTRTGAAIHGSFLVDTGSRMGLLLNQPFASQHDLPNSGPAVRNAVVGIGLGGESRGDIFRVASLSWGALEVDDVPAVASRDTRGVFSMTTFAGVIGADLLRRYTLWLDYPHNRLVFERPERPAGPFAVDQSGMFLLAADDPTQGMHVYDVIDHLPAATAGIVPGDVIVAVDGRHAAPLGLDRVREIFAQPGQRHAVALRRGRRITKTELRTGDVLR